MDFLVVENDTITNIIIADSEIATEIGAKEWYDGAEIGGAYSPPPAYTDTELIQQDITDLQIAGIETQQDITELQLTVLEGQT